MRTAARGLIALLAGLMVAACGGAPTESGRVDLTVLVAASLADVFAGIAEAFEAAHAGIDVTLAAAGSQRLAAQVLDGAHADVVALADDIQMDRLARAGLLDGVPAVFATNELALAVAQGNPQGVRSLEDLARDDLLVVLAHEHVPAGRYSRLALDTAGVRTRPVSLEADVRAVLAKVALGEADVGIVYATDLVDPPPTVTGIALEAAADVRARYEIAVLRDAPAADAAAALTDFVTGSRGRALLDDAGFGPP